MAWESGVRLEPELVGDQHHEILRSLMGRFHIDPDTGRWALRQGRGGLVVLTGESGVGKSRIVREVYRALRANQSQPGYWPELAPTGGATVANGPDSGLAVFGFRKSVGPESAGFVWHANSVPDYLWWSIACQTASGGGFLDAQALFANELLRHQDPARFGWARAAGGKRWAARATQLLQMAGGAVVDEGKNEAVGLLLAEVAGQAVPFGGLVTRSLKALTGAAIKAADRKARLASDIELGAVTGGKEDPTDTLAAVVASLARPGFPVVVAVEDLHDADDATLELIARLAGSGFQDRVLVIATAWPGALSSRLVEDVQLGDWLGAHSARMVSVDPLDGAAVSELVRSQFEGTTTDRVETIAQRWSNPLAVSLVLDLFVADGAVTSNAITADDRQIVEIPADLAGVYDQQFARLPLEARSAVILHVICGADAVSARDFGREPDLDASWTPVDPSQVLAAAQRHGLDPAGFDHHLAVSVGWLTLENDWAEPREPGLAHAAWRAMRGHRLRGDAPHVRAEAARLLAKLIARAAESSDGTQGLLFRGDRWWLRESAWMVRLAPALPDDRDVQDAAARASFELFQFEAAVRPQEALREWAAWADTWEALLGPDHPDTFIGRTRLANAYASAGHLGRAILLLEQTLDDQSRVLGDDHLETSAGRIQLAAAYRSAGDVTRAVSLLEQAYEDRRRELGVDDPGTLAAANNLAVAYRTAGDVGRAVSLLERTLEEMRRVLGVDHADTLAAANNLAVIHQSMGNVGLAVSMLEQAIEDMRRVFGDDHPSTLATCGNLAGAYRAGGDFSRAITLLEQTLADRRRILGEDHPSTLVAANNLATTYVSTGDLRRAIPLLVQTLVDMESVLDPEHPEIYSARVNLAGAYRAAGDLSRAIPLLKQCHADMSRLLGADHPDALTAATNLAGAYLTAGDLTAAAGLFEKALADRLRVMGADHPSTLSTRVNLAATYAAAGDVGLGTSLLEQALVDTQRVLGESHPDSMSAMLQLASACMSAGDVGRAITLLERVLADRTGLLGRDHPDTLAARVSLAVAYRWEGNSGKAISLLEQAISDMNRVLGAGHPDTLSAVSNLAVAYLSVGDSQRAIPLLEQILTARKEVLGEDHPNTLAGAVNLAAAYQSSGDPDQAILLMEQTLSDLERVLGVDHPDTMTAASNLAVTYGSVGDTLRAIPLLQQTLLQRHRVQGPDHPATLSASVNLALAYESAGDLGRAIPLLKQTLADRQRVLGRDHPETIAVREALVRAQRARNSY